MNLVGGDERESNFTKFGSKCIGFLLLMVEAAVAEKVKLSVTEEMKEWS